MECQHLPQATGADHAQDGGGADVVLPPVQRVAEKLRKDLRQAGIEEHPSLLHATYAQRETRTLRSILDRFGEQAAQHSSRVDRKGQRAGQRPETRRNQQQRRPHQFRNAAQHIEQQPRRRPPQGPVTDVGFAGRKRQQQAENRGQQGADHRHRQRLQRGRQQLGEELRLGAWRQQFRQEAAHARYRVTGEKAAPLQVERREAEDHQRQQRQHEPAGLAARVEQRRRQPVDLVGGRQLAGFAAAHASALRNQALRRSVSATSATNTISMVLTSAPLNIFIDESICWPRPPAPTKPSTAEERIAHSQR